MTISHKNLGLLLGFLGMCLFAGTLPATRLAVSGFTPLFLTVARAALAGSAGLIVLVALRRPVPPRSLWLEIFGAALCTVLGFPLFAALAMMTVPAAHGGVVLGILPLATAAAAAIFAHERPSLGFWLASAAGALIVVTFMLRRSGGETFVCRRLVLAWYSCCRSARIYVFRPPGDEDAGMGGYLLASCDFPAACGAGDFCSMAGRYYGASISSWAGLGYVGLVSQYTAFFVFNAALAIGGIARVGQVMLLQPFVIVALALPVNGEPIDIETILFAAAVVATVLIGQRMRVVRR